jgi:peroxiredoxin
MTATGTIAERVNELHAGMAGHVPDEVLAINARDRASLAASGTPESVATVGSVLADADLIDVNGASTTLYAAIGEAPAVVVFYRGAWCPYCNVALRAYQEHLLPELTRRGFAMIAVSPQTPDGSLSMQEKNELTFTVVSDPSNTLARELGILTVPSDEVRAVQLKLGLDITKACADGTATLPIPTTLILDATHVVRWIDVHPDYSTRSEPAQILAAIEDAGLEAVSPQS